MINLIYEVHIQVFEFSNLNILNFNLRKVIITLENKQFSHI